MHDMNAPTPRLKRQNPDAQQSGTGRIFARHHQILAIMALTFITMSGVYWQITAAKIAIPTSGFPRTGLQNVPQDPARDPHVNKRFILGGLELGMTLDMLKAVYPTAKTGWDRFGNRVASIVTPRNSMVVWIRARAAEHNTGRIYRLKLSKAFPILTEQEILRRYGREYGRPLETACVRSAPGTGVRCTYRWLGGGGIDLQVISKQKTDKRGRTYTQLTTIATDTAKPE